MMPLFKKKNNQEDIIPNEEKTIESPDTRHFYERMKGDIDFQSEYQKLEVMLCSVYDKEFVSLNTMIEMDFLKWKKRGRFTSFQELRQTVGFPITLEKSTIVFGKDDTNMYDYFAYCEMILSIIFDLESQKMLWSYENAAAQMLHTIRSVLDEVGYAIAVSEGKVLVVKKDVAAEVAAESTTQTISDAIREYNHYPLKGNLDKKRALLLVLADGLEPEEKWLKDKGLGDLFDLFNNMNIRHNNLQPGHKNYQETVAKMSKQELEQWYDDIYQMALLAYLTIQQRDRQKRIDAYKAKRGK